MTLTTVETKLNKKSGGFTVLELIVSIIIFITITALTLATFRGGTRKEDLKIARGQIVNDLRNLRSNSLSGQLIKICQKTGTDGVITQEKLCEGGGGCLVGYSCTDSVPLGGYGLHLALCGNPPCSYALFADLDQDSKFDSPAEKISNGVKSFANNIRVYNFRSHNGAIWRPDPGPINIVFLPYNIQVSMRGGIITSLPGNSNNSNNSNTAGQVDKVVREEITLRDKNNRQNLSFIINGDSGTIIESK